MAVNTTANDSVRWAAVAAKDRRHDGRFLFGVVTTGVFCRPSCPARTPHQHNVRFFDDAAAAIAAGFRPCRRCHPLRPGGTDPAAQRIRAACEFIGAHAGESLPLKMLATRAGLSVFHFQRTFRALVGVTPKQYADACRLEALKTALRAQPSVTTAIYSSGYNSSSRVYESIDARLGMTPGAYRAGGAGIAISCASADTPLGRLMVAATDRGVCFVRFGQSHAALRALLAEEFPAARIAAMRPAANRMFRTWMAGVLSHLSGTPATADIPLDIRATAFQARVWRYLQSVPPGEVRSYSEVARAIGQPAAVRAVARACASNPVAGVIPCHRVIRGDGGLGGYRWGLDRKQALLDRERTALGVR